MFDVGFSELVLLFIIGLLVLGPEKLPRVANKIGSWVGQARRMTRMLKRQIEEELEFSKVRESVNQPLSSILDKPSAKPGQDKKRVRYEEVEDDESGFGETGHADADEESPDRPVPDPEAPAPAAAREATDSQAAARSGHRAADEAAPADAETETQEKNKQASS